MSKLGLNHKKTKLFCNNRINQMTSIVNMNKFKSSTTRRSTKMDCGTHTSLRTIAITKAHLFDTTKSS